jgi:NAD(P)H-quinone oxidoreductase subunit 5
MYLVPLLAPVLLVSASLLGFIGPGLRPRLRLRLIELITLIALAVALTTAAVQVGFGPGSGYLPLGGDLVLSVRVDSVSATMLLLVAFIGWVVVRYAVNHLDGEPRQGAFTGWLCMTLAAVMVLVTAGNLLEFIAAWVGTSVFLHQLLLFYPERVAAQRAARKKSLFSRIGDVSLLAAFVLLVSNYGTLDLAQILTAARVDGGNPYSLGAAGLIALAALLKSAQFPTHGWLIEVMETPTPVSALLHAGVINAGGFLLIRFADVMVLAPSIMAVLVMVGGFTALFGCCVMLTQAAVKVSLAWSTVGQMGFMMLECGLGLFPLALLHIVAHSLYKAHSFLVAGAAVETIAASRRPGVVAIPNAAAVGRAFLLALTIYVAVGFAFGFQHKSPQAIALGAILIFGVAYLVAQGLADLAPRALTWRTILYALTASISYFALQFGAVYMTRHVLPPVRAPGPLEWALILLAVLSFAAIAVVQAMFPLWADHPAAAGLRVHLSNGLYVNAVLDRLLGGWSVRQSDVSASRGDRP